jgi:hypothetical protein
MSKIIPDNRNVRVLLMLMLVTSSLLFTSFGCDASPKNWPSDSFSAKSWSALPKEKRYVVYNDLVKSKKLDGLSMNEVLSLLGPPDYKSPDNKYFNYTLKNAEKGEYSFNAIYFLQIDFEAQGKVTNYFMRAD